MLNLEILVKNNPVQTYKGNNGLTYIEGRKNSEYTIRIRNNTSTKKKVVVSVDGLNVLNGEKEWENGYVVDKWSTIDIPGWRIDNNKVSKFKFESLKKTYNQDDQSNVGVIGVMAFNEEVVNNWVYNGYPYWNKDFDDYWQTKKTYPSYPRTLKPMYIVEPSFGTCNIGSVLCGSSASCNTATSITNNVETDKLTNNVGTGWGDEKEFKTVEDYTKFNDISSETISIYYDDANGLKAYGIEVKKTPTVRKKPEAFPGYKTLGCKPPSWVK